MVWTVFIQRKCFYLVALTQSTERTEVLVAFKQRRCFSVSRLIRVEAVWVLIAFKQRRCFSPRAGVCVVEMRGVGRFQTAKVFLLVAKSYRGTRSATGVDRFQTAKVFLLIATSCAVNWVRVLVAFKQRRCFSKKEYSSVRQHRGVGRFQTAKVFLLWTAFHKPTKWGVGRFQTAKVFLQRGWCPCAFRPGVGRFQTAKVFLRASAAQYNMALLGVGRFQTAKVFLHMGSPLTCNHIWCWSLSNSEGVSPVRRKLHNR